MKILLVEDQNELRSLIRNYLQKNKFLVDGVEDGQKALDLISNYKYDCIILDLNLPKVDGIDVAKKIREMKIDTPIIMLTARSQMYDKLTGFDVGADDYITKPFDMKELLARVEAVLRRGKKQSKKNICFGEYVVYPDKNRLKNKGKEIVLSNKEMGILEYLINNKDRIISSEELLENIWDREVDMFSDTVKTHIKTLRKKVDSKKELIKTVRGKGYVYTKK